MNPAQKRLFREKIEQVLNDEAKKYPAARRNLAFTCLLIGFKLGMEAATEYFKWKNYYDSSNRDSGASAFWTGE